MPPRAYRVSSAALTALLGLACANPFHEPTESEQVMNHLVLQVDCGKGDAAACAEVDRLDQEGCVAGEPNACWYAGNSYLYPQGGSSDVGKAIPYFQRACDLGEKNGCESLASAKRREEQRVGE